jgi:hypothetical protein
VLPRKNNIKVYEKKNSGQIIIIHHDKGFCGKETGWGMKLN